MFLFFFAIRCLVIMCYSLSWPQDCTSSLQADTCSCSLAATLHQEPETVSISKYKAYNTASSSVKHLLCNTFWKKKHFVYILGLVSINLYVCASYTNILLEIVIYKWCGSLSLTEKSVSESLTIWSTEITGEMF